VTFGKFGKNVKDLFKKKYDFDHQLKVIHKTNAGETLESGAVVSDSAALKGYLKAKYAAPSWGETEGELWTTPENESKATVKLTKLVNGLNVTFGATTKDKDETLKDAPVGSVDAEYGQANVAAQVVLKSNLGKHKVDASVTIGADGLSAGGQITLDASSGVHVAESNVGVEYTQADVTGSLFTEKNRSVLNLALYQKPTLNQIIGAQFKYNLEKKSRALTLGGEHRIDVDTSVRGKVDLPTGDVAAVVEHRLNNPALLLQIAAQFATKPVLVSQKLGITVSFGDF